MTDERRKRLATMGARFEETKKIGRPPSGHNRARQSIYMDATRWKDATVFCKEVLTALYVEGGLEANKFDVHEEVFAFAAEHRAEIVARLRERLAKVDER